MNNVAIADKLDMSYDYHNKDNMHAVEWKLLGMISKDKNLMNIFNRNNWRHPIIRKYSQVLFKIY